ncbi:MAG: sodium:proton antiporter [Chthoniobacterales bacterium]
MKNLLITLPFVLMLLSVAFMPFVHQHWWEAHFRKVATFFAAIIIFYYALVLHDGHRLSLALHDYLSFIILIGSLFVVTGGIHLRVRGQATPMTNVLFLIIGAVLANFIGTTGASMLLIRPWITMNRYRITAFHIIFFIFIVSNVGGCLSPIGDPPLFLGFLRGVPFFWLIKNLWPAWLLAIGLLTGVFYFFDKKNFLRAPCAIRELETENESWKISGLFNLGSLFLIIGAVFLPSPYRELLMMAAAVLSYRLTPKTIFEMNKFTFYPIEEVAWLFFGIFATMIPVLDYVEGPSVLSLLSTWNLGPKHFYYLTGILSAFLDNAPTYVTFFEMHLGLLGMGHVSHVAAIVTQDVKTIMALSLGAVFFGAMTYIGNGPNFMVKTIAEKADIRMPGFFSYLLSYSLPILLPVLLLIGWIFL